VVVLWWPSVDWLLSTRISLLCYLWDWWSCWLHHAALWPCSTNLHKSNSIARGDIRWQGTRPSHHHQEVEEKMSHVCLLYSTWTIHLHLLLPLQECMKSVCPLLHFPPFLPLLFHSLLFCLTIITVSFSSSHYLSLEAIPADKSPPLVATTLQGYGGKSNYLPLLLITISIFPSSPLLLVGGPYFTRST